MPDTQTSPTAHVKFRLQLTNNQLLLQVHQDDSWLGEIKSHQENKTELRSSSESRLTLA